jgi:hypothetical protein
MARRMTRLLLATACCLALAAPVGAGTWEQLEDANPSWWSREQRNVADAHGRQADQLTNPEFSAHFGAQAAQAFAEATAWQGTHPDRTRLTLQLVPGGAVADPHRALDAWADERGSVTDVAYTNRYGALLQGRLWAPPEGRFPAPYPTVLITPGSAQAHEGMYHWAAQGLAEAGYLVLTFDIQGQGRSETWGRTPEGDHWCGEPEPPGQAWEDEVAPEQGDCPGVPFQQLANFVRGTVDSLDFLLSTPAAAHAHHREDAEADGAMDHNPWAHLVDPNRVGLAAHSVGAEAISAVQGHDRRVHAIAAWDNLLPLAPARVPALGMNPDYAGLAVQPFRADPDPDARNAGFRAWRDAGVDVMQITPRGSSHLDWSYIPLVLPGSRHGERVAMYYTLAWFDRYLRGDRSALDRLTAYRYDGSADASAIGTGAWDPRTGNAPHRIEGQSAGDRLSFYFRSSYWLEGGRVTCDDVRSRSCGSEAGPAHPRRGA